MKEFKLKDPLLSQAEYEQMYQQSFADKEGFWSKIANEQLTWFKNFSQVKNTSFEVMLLSSGLRMVSSMFVIIVLIDMQKKHLMKLQ
jgi:hypothetical protein